MSWKISLERRRQEAAAGGGGGGGSCGGAAGGTRKRRGSKQSRSRCDFVSTLRDPQPCSPRDICISTGRRSATAIARRRSNLFTTPRIMALRYRARVRVADKWISRRRVAAPYDISSSFRAATTISSLSPYIFPRIERRCFVSQHRCRVNADRFLVTARDDETRGPPFR